MASPIPDAAPVTSAVLSVRSNISFYRIPQNAEPLDLDFAYVAVLGKYRRLACKPDARRCAGRDHIPRLERDRTRQELDELGNSEDKLGGRGILHRLTVQSKLDSQFMRIRDLVLRRDK